MKKIKNFNFLYLSLIMLFLVMIIVSIFNYIDVLGTKFANTLIYLTLFIVLVLNSFKIARKSKNKGIIVGLKIAALIISIICIFKLIFKSNFTLWTFIYILLIFLATIISTIYGANKKSSNV